MAPPSLLRWQRSQRHYIWLHLWLCVLVLCLLYVTVALELTRLLKIKKLFGGWTLTLTSVEPTQLLFSLPIYPVAV